MLASVHDLVAARGMLETMKADSIIVDKAYADKELKEQMQVADCDLLTLLKDKKEWQGALKQREQAFHNMFNKAVSTIRQPIESLFNRINELTYLQNASKVRSADGLKLHLYGKLADALLLLSNF